MVADAALTSVITAMTLMMVNEIRPTRINSSVRRMVRFGRVMSISPNPRTRAGCLVVAQRVKVDKPPRVRAFLLETNSSKAVILKQP